MAELQVATTRGRTTPLPEAAIEQFRGRVRAEVLRSSDQAYEPARKAWNGMIDKRPAMILRCRGAADVIESVRFARDRDLLVSVRGGGHNIAGKAVCAGGVMIDLSAMRSVHVDPVRRTARVAGGVTLGDLDHEPQAFGLATTGVVTTTGVAGGWRVSRSGAASAGSPASMVWRATTP